MCDASARAAVSTRSDDNEMRTYEHNYRSFDCVSVPFRCQGSCNNWARYALKRARDSTWTSLLDQHS